MESIMNCPTLEATQAIAGQLAELLFPGAILLLEGNLGSGKTAFVKGLGKALGITETIVSPTFTLIDEYTDGRLPLYHMDLYRLEPSAIAGLHLDEYWRGVDFPWGIVAIEWAERLPVLPEAYLRICLAIAPVSESASLENDGDAMRQLRFEPVGDRYAAIVTSLLYRCKSWNKAGSIS